MIGKIYIITEKETGQIIYVGSTTFKKLSKRMGNHYNNWFVGKLSHYLATYIRSKCSNLQEYHEKFEHQVIREYEVKDLRHLHQIEERWRKHLKPLCNKNQAYCPDRKLYLREYGRKHMREYRASKKLQ